MSVPRAALTRATRRIAISELPPISKKLEVALTCATPSRSAKTPATISSTGFSGPTNSDAATVNSGAGSAFRSSLPLALRGSESSTTTCEGTMYPGSRRPASAITSAESTA
ncbi:unannotated protein [freshwater metagenome]|uniref:Unannotated protein n=1 Tax=freshwater metagenome TaxID=449393 RepID=A0A6J7IY81_9ZZZZ